MEQTYKIGEAATLLNLKTYVLRFWETEFPQIAPLRTEKGQRLYTPKDIELLERIKYLLHEQGLTIDGARKILESPEADAFISTEPATFAIPPIPSPMEPSLPQKNIENQSTKGTSSQTLQTIIKDLEEVADILRGAPTKGNCVQ